ncbi:MAG: hypothetical protein RLZZ427_1713 [Pseudomonadota bacterium]|jgi:hydroxyethylthiazole kinase-like uncharacterized protein yjeF
MPGGADQILSVAQMRRAEDALIAAGTSVDALMQIAGRGAAEYVWRISGGRAVTVLCGPGNNGGDGYVIAQALHERGAPVRVIAAVDPGTAAARNARAVYAGEICGPATAAEGEVFVDCLFGSGLTRPLNAEHLALIQRLAASHRHSVAIDLPSGVDSDLGLPLNPGLPPYSLTVALGAWKFAHFLMPSAVLMGALRMVSIGVAEVPGAVRVISRPHLAGPMAAAHKYTRGLLGVVGGAMPGAAVLAAIAAQGAGAGYVKLLAAEAGDIPIDVVADLQPLAEALLDRRFAALLIGPGLGRDGQARERLAVALSEPIPAVLDADALVLLGARQLAERKAPLIATPHEGELAALERAFGCAEVGSKVIRAQAVARASGMVVVAKGPDTVIAAPDGTTALAPRASSWLSVAGTGDVLAGIIASRLATGAAPFAAACEGVWLHGEAARLAGAAFAAGQLAQNVRSAYAACL